MKVLLVAAYYKPHMGGVENYTKNLSETLARMGHKVVVLTSKLTRNDPYLEQDASGYKVIRLPSLHLANKRFPLLLHGKETNMFAREFSEEHFDGVIINTRYYPFSLYTARIAAKNNIPCFVIDHSSHYLSLGNPIADCAIKAYEHLVTSKLMKNNPSFFAVAHDGTKWLKTFGIEAKGILYNAIDANEFRKQSSKRDFRNELSLGETCLVTFTGRLIREKGVWTCLEIANKMQHEGFAFLIAGNGPEFESLKKMAPDNLHLLGRLEHPDIAALLKQSDVFLFPSTYPEGFPTSLLEAAAAECFIITTPIGGAYDLIPSEEFGTVLSSDFSTEDICDALRQAKHESPHVRGCNVRLRVEEQFTWKATSAAIVSTLQNTQNAE